MPDPLRYILIGTGGAGAIWARNALPRLMEMQKAIPVAVADPSDERLQFAQEYLHLTPQNCFTDPMEAMENRRADFAIIAMPTPQHEKLIDAALTHDMHILCEAPVADDAQGQEPLWGAADFHAHPMAHDAFDAIKTLEGTWTTEAGAPIVI